MKTKKNVATAEQWENRVEVKSASSDRIYVISQHKTKRHWACSCPSWKTRRTCKHLDQLGLPGGEKPFERKTESKLLSGYKRYDASDGFGNPDEWRKSMLAALDVPADVAGLDDGEWAGVVAAFGKNVEAAVWVVLDENRKAAEAVDPGKTAPAKIAEAAQTIRLTRFRAGVLAQLLADASANIGKSLAEADAMLRARLA